MIGSAGDDSQAGARAECLYGGRGEGDEGGGKEDEDGEAGGGYVDLFTVVTIVSTTSIFIQREDIDSGSMPH